MAQVNCKKCGRQVNAQVKYCPFCGNLLKKNILARVFFFIIAVSIIFIIYPKLTKKIDEEMLVEYTDPSISITASRLYEIYEKNELAADENYKGKVISVNGYIDSIGKDMIGKFYICLKTKEGPCSIKCFFDKAHKKKVSSQQKGTHVTITGRCDGKRGSVLLRKCKF